ncbi:helix-turn-helix domain-containing protein, partial [Nanoarchaeota archaeon]
MKYMHYQKVFEEMKNSFGLKQNHIGILNYLLYEDLAAGSISKKTKIPLGRIYDFLNDLINWRLIAKKRGKPAKYTMQDPKMRILDFLKRQSDNFAEKELKVTEMLRDEGGEDIEVINDSNQFTFALMKALAKYNHFRIIDRYQALPYILYPQDEKDYMKMREVISKNRITLSGRSPEVAVMFFKAFKEAYQSGKKFEYITSVKAVDFYASILKKNFKEEDIK